MKRIIGLALVLSALVFAPQSANAWEHLKPRMKLLVHGSHTVLDAPQLQLRAHVVPDANFNDNKFAPLAFAGLGIQATSWLNIEPVLGWNFAANEAVVSTRLRMQVGDFWSWVDFEFRPYRETGFGGYWFVQAEYTVRPWLHLGAEEESSGAFREWHAFTHGGGPNVLFRFHDGMFRLDLAVHFRETADHRVGEEVVMRGHLAF